MFCYNKEGLTVFNSVERNVTDPIIFLAVTDIRSYRYICLQVFGEKSQPMDHFVVEEQQDLLSKDIEYQLQPVVRKIHTTDEINTLFPNIVKKKGES